jgi:pyruvate dehydrogenase E1 component alpha subunit
MPNNPFPLAKPDLMKAYRIMRTIREFEERLHVEFAKGDIPGFVHLYAGEEACATGIMMHLNDIDRIASTHRGHGHCIAKGVDVHDMMAEIYGKVNGACRGKGGSMHIADLSKGMMGANGILGAGAPLICGAGLAAKFRGDGGVGITFFGDGASNQGTVQHEPAAVWNPPVIRRAENNGYAEPPGGPATAVDNYVDRAWAWAVGVTVDGIDFFVLKPAGEIISRARSVAALAARMPRDLAGHLKAMPRPARPRARTIHRSTATASSRPASPKPASSARHRRCRGFSQGGAFADGKRPPHRRLRRLLTPARTATGRNLPWPA